MITLNFSVDDQLLTRTDENTVAANSHLVHTCEFDFSSEWDGRGKVATFRKRNLRISVILDNDACVIPPEILHSEHMIDVFEVSVYGANGNSTITSTIVRVPILAGTWDAFPEEITPTMFEQIMAKLEEIEENELTIEDVNNAIEEYFEEHPDLGLNPAEVFNAITRSGLINLTPNYVDYTDGLEKTDTAAGVNYYVIAPGHIGSYDSMDYGCIMANITGQATAESVFTLVNTSEYLPAGKYKLRNTWSLSAQDVEIVYSYINGADNEVILATVDSEHEVVDFEITPEIITAGYSQRFYIRVKEGAEYGAQIYPLLTYGYVTNFDNIPNSYVRNNAELTQNVINLEDSTTNLQGRMLNVETGKQDKTQYAVMPAASADLLGKIYQYTGATNANYTQGHWYKCVENSGVYSWEDVSSLPYVTPQMFGAKGDGVTDDWEAVRTAFQKSHYVYFPAGTYLVEKHNERIELDGDVLITGEGEDSILFFNDTPTSGVSLFSGSLDSLTIKNMSFESTLTELDYDLTNTAQLFYFTRVDIVDIEHCSFSNFRANCMSSRTQKVTLIDNKYYKIARDSNRFLEAYDTYVANCEFILCGDDVVSFHNTNQNRTGKHVFTGNRLELSFGAGYLGGSNIFMNNNTFVNARYLFKAGISGQEGKKSENIYFINNVVYPANHDSGGSNITGLYGECDNVHFENNDILTTPPHNEELILEPGGIYKNVSIYPYAIILSAIENGANDKISNIFIKNNRFMSKVGTQSGGVGRHATNYINLGTLQTENVIVENNLFYDGLNQNFSGNVRKYIIRGNIFDCDPDNVIATDGVFANSTACWPIPQDSLLIENNDFYNCSGDYHTYGEGNRFHSDFANDFKGCNPIHYGQSIAHIIVPYDYASKTDRNQILLNSATMPTSGYYIRGHFVQNTNMFNSVYGWLRLTSGDQHVLDTDWQAITL